MMWKPISTSVYNSSGDNCGTGAGGFQEGNDCGKKRTRGAGAKLTTDYQKLRRAFEDDPDDELNTSAMADWYEEQGDRETSRMLRERKEVRSYGKGIVSEGSPTYVRYLMKKGVIPIEDERQTLVFPVSEKLRQVYPELKKKQFVYIGLHEDGYKEVPKAATDARWWIRLNDNFKEV